MGIFSFLNRFVKVERDNVGNWSYWLKGDGFGSDSNYLELSMTNPVLMTVIALRCKLYSQMMITAVDKNEKEVDIPELKLLNNPNYFQSKQDYFFQQMWFISAVGSSYTYQIRPFTSEAPKAIYNLIPNKTDFKDVFKINKFITTQQDIREFERSLIKYELDKTEYKLPLKDIIPFYDLSNGLEHNSLMKSPSRVQGIRKVLYNIEENLKAKKINLEMSQKYIATNKSSPDGNPQLRTEDREDIEKKFGHKSLNITNANVEVSHLVTDLKKLYLDEQFASDALKVLLAFDMNRDVLNYASVGTSSYDNAVTGLVSVIQNSIQGSADNTMNSYTNSWGLAEKGIRLKASFNHLPIMQALVKSKTETLNTLSTSLKTAIESGFISQQEATEQYNKTKKELGL